MKQFFRLLASVALAAAFTCAGCGSSDTSQEDSAATHESLATTQEKPAAARNSVVNQPKDNLKRPNNTRNLSARGLVKQMASAGLETEEIDLRPITVDDSSRFPEEPRSVVRYRVSDGEGNSAPITFVEFSSWEAAARLETKSIDGFAVRNWFGLGTSNNYFRKRIADALDAGR